MYNNIIATLLWSRGYHTTTDSHTTIQQSFSIREHWIPTTTQANSRWCTFLFRENSHLVVSDLVMVVEEESWVDRWRSRPLVAANCSKEHSFSLSTIHTTSSSMEWANLWSASSDWAKHLWWFSFSHFFMIATGGRGGTATCSPCLKRGSLSHKTQPKNRNLVIIMVWSYNYDNDTMWCT